MSEKSAHKNHLPYRDMFYFTQICFFQSEIAEQHNKISFQTVLIALILKHITYTV